MHVKTARLAQTFGAGVTADDNRVFAQFARNIIAGEDIVLHTTGELSRCYCYTVDAIEAILFILLKGEDGEAYNVANEDTYCSIYEMASVLQQGASARLDAKIRHENHVPASHQFLESIICISLKSIHQHHDIHSKENIQEYIGNI